MGCNFFFFFFIVKHVGFEALKESIYIGVRLQSTCALPSLLFAFLLDTGSDWPFLHSVPSLSCSNLVNIPYTHPTGLQH